MFFVSWALWEKMTFVLALCILLVFAIGYAKLLMMNRMVRKQELVDEERRTRIQALRSSGHIVESRKSHDIPFGVRAIQSGIQVDGIWISQANTPAASELKLGSGEASPEMISTPGSMSGHVSPDIRPTPRHTLQPQHISEVEIPRTFDRGNAAQDAAVTPGSSGNRESYKPRKASHLRYGNYGEYDQATLEQLEGHSSAPKTHRPRPSSSRQIEQEAESSAADNELSSGVSSHSDISLSQNTHSSPETRDETLLGLLGASAQALVNSVQTSTPFHSSNAEYLSVPAESPILDVSDPFQTPLASPTDFRIPMASGPTTSPKPEDPGLHTAGITPHESETQSPFIPGELHVNKSVRKVNSGFEVLPAGTFSIPVELKGKGIETDFEDDSGDRRQSKLLKKPRPSMI